MDTTMTQHWATPLLQKLASGRKLPKSQMQELETAGYIHTDEYDCLRLTTEGGHKLREKN